VAEAKDQNDLKVHFDSGNRRRCFFVEFPF